MGDKLLGGGSLLLLILSFVGPWAKVEVEGFGDLVPGASASGNAWRAYGFFPLKLGLLIASVLLVVVILRAAGVNLPEYPAVAEAAGGALVLLLVILAIVMGPAGSGVEGFGVEINRGLMLFISIIPAAAVAAGGYLAMQERGGATPTMGGMGTGPAAPPPPPA